MQGEQSYNPTSRGKEHINEIKIPKHDQIMQHVSMKLKWANGNENMQENEEHTNGIKNSNANI